MTHDDALALADHILALVNSQPRTPTRDEIATSFLSWWDAAVADSCARHDKTSGSATIKDCCGDPADCNRGDCLLNQCYRAAFREGLQLAQLDAEKLINCQYTHLHMAVDLAKANRRAAKIMSDMDRSEPAERAMSEKFPGYWK